LELLAVTGRWVTPDGKLSKALLNLHNLPEGHAGKLTAACLFETIQSLRIKNPGYITSDNATCNDTMMAELSRLLDTIDIVWDPVQYRTRCFGHQNNLILQAFWNHTTEEAVEKARETNLEDPVAVLARKDTGLPADQSVQLLECLMKTIKGTRRLAQKFRLLTGLVPVTNNTTRWNSYYRMFERALACHETLSEWQWKYPELRKFALHKEDWLVIQNTYDFLKQFLVLTKETEGDQATLEQVRIFLCVSSSC
jgi:hypothetical protein